MEYNKVIMTVVTFGDPQHRRDPHVWGRPAALAVLVGYEGLTGLLNILFAAATLLVVNGYWQIAPLSALRSLVMRELAEDPQDLLFNWLAGNLPRISPDDTLHLAWLVCGFGLIKLAIAGGLWFKTKETRLAALAVFGLFAVYGFWRLILAFSWWKAGAIGIDLFFIYYFWWALPRHLARDRALGA